MAATIPRSSSQASGDGGPLRVLTVGGGALGILYSFLLARAGCHVAVLARSNAQLLRDRGVDLESIKYGNHAAWRPDQVVDEAQAAEQDWDYILCTFKLVPELQPTSEVIRKLIKPPAPGQTREQRPVIVFVENGVGIEEEPYRVLCSSGGGDQDSTPPLASTVISCCAWLGANLVDGGSKVVHGALERLEMGLYPTPGYEERDGALPGEAHHASWRRRKLVGLVDAFNAGGGGGELHEDIQPRRWRKLLWNVGWGGLCVLSRASVQMLLDDDCVEHSTAVAHKTMLELLHVARAVGISESQMPSSAVSETILITLNDAPSRRPAGAPTRVAPNFKPSILLDLEAKRPMELVGTVESVVARARDKRVATPRLDLLLASLRIHQVVAVREARARLRPRADEEADVQGEGSRATRGVGERTSAAAADRPAAAREPVAVLALPEGTPVGL